MTVFLWEKKLTYVSAPKVACTSLKHMFFEIENGFRFTPFHANGQMKHIHNTVYPGKVFENLPHKRIADHTRLCVVRDPLKRFLSCYSNRVVHHGELGPKRIPQAFKDRGALPNPTLKQFIDRFEIYHEAAQTIRNHSRPFVNILGRDPGYFHGIYRIEEIEVFRGRVAEIVGGEPVLRRHQTGGPKLSPDDLTAAEVRKIRALYEEDYDIFGRFF